MTKETKAKIWKILIIVLGLAAIILAIYLPLQLSGAMDRIRSVDDLRQIILDAGIYSYLIFFVIQFVQVTFLPIPAFVSTVAGTLVFGPWIAAGISYVAIMAASIFSFFLGRKIGRRFVVWVVGEETTAKWQSKLERGKYAFFLMMLFPIFPDDILCLVVGATTSMTYRFFIITNLITRPIAIITTCFFGSGLVIPFSGWGIPVWIALVIVGIALFYISLRYQPQIENIVAKLSDKMSGKKDKEE